MLIDQPTAAPTRKVTAYSVGGLVATVAAGFLVEQIPGLSEACAENLSIWVYTAAGGGIATVVGFISAYFRREKI